MDEARLEALRSSLAADGYHMEVRRDGDRVGVEISASPEACADCLVPKNVMREILRPVFGVAGESIDLTYPSESGSAAS